MSELQHTQHGVVSEGGSGKSVAIMLTAHVQGTMAEGCTTLGAGKHLSSHSNLTGILSAVQTTYQTVKHVALRNTF